MAAAERSSAPPRRGRGEIFRALLRETVKTPACIGSAAVAIGSAAWMIATGASAGGLLGVIAGAAAGMSAWTVNYFFRTERFLDKVRTKWRKEDEARLASEIAEVEALLDGARLTAPKAHLRDLLRLRGELEQALSGSVFSFQREDLLRAAAEMIVSSLESLRHLVAIRGQMSRFNPDSLERDRRQLEKTLEKMDLTDPLYDVTRKKATLVADRIHLARTLSAKEMEIDVTLDQSRHVLEKALVDRTGLTAPDSGSLEGCLNFFNDQVELTRKVNEGLRSEMRSA